MAKKKRRVAEEVGEEYEFIPEEFNEKEFIYKDIYGTKVLIVTTLLAIIIGVVGALLCYIDDEFWIVATLISFATVGLMKKILTLFGFRADLMDFKTMGANYFIFLCLALGVCMLLLNAPFH